jgi:hypothetical protein
MRQDDEAQLELPLRAAPRLRVIRGEGQGRPDPLDDRDAVARVLVSAGVDLLLKRISPERAEYIEQKVDEVLDLFDAVDQDKGAQPRLAKALEDLEALVRETAAVRQRRRI